MVAVLTGFVLAAFTPLLYRLLPARVAGVCFACVPFGLGVYFASLAGEVFANRAVTSSFAWADNLGVRASFRVDGLSLLFALLITFIGALVFLYAGGYLKNHRDTGGFYALLSLFMASMLGLVLSDNLLLMFIFWELTSISSYLLIGFEHEDADARRSAWRALLVTGSGGLAMFAGFVMLGEMAGGYELPKVLSAGAQIRAHEFYTPALLLILAGAFTKSAQFPFHFWLPGAMAAPTPVSAYLHSATMVKAGIFLLARLTPAIGGTSEWTSIVTSVGAVTMLIGGIVAFYQTNLKLLLAYSTVSALGLITMLLGLNTDYAVQAAMTFLLAHAMYKGSLFMIAGAIDHATGTKDVALLGGLRRVMPITFITALTACISLAGFGFVLSFIGKEMMLEAVLERSNIWLTLAATVAGALFTAVALVIALRPFFGALKQTPVTAHEAPASMWFGSATLAVAGIVFGVLPNLFVAPLVSSAASAVTQKNQFVKLALWHGFNPALALSVISVALGFALYFMWNKLRSATAFTPHLFAAQTWFEAAGAGVERFARFQFRVLQSGYLRFYLMIIVAATVVLAAFTLITKTDEFPPVISFADLRFYELGLGLLIVAAGYAAVRSTYRLRSVAALGIVGIGVGTVFIFYGAPDLAMTQFLIETLSVVLLVLVLYHLPRFARLTKLPARVRDIAISLSFGALMTTLVLVAGKVEFNPQVSNFYAERSLPDAHGRNIVNVILVDFRALDTLGEITVLAIAAAGVYALMKLRPLTEQEGSETKARK